MTVSYTSSKGGVFRGRTLRRAAAASLAGAAALGSITFGGLAAHAEPVAQIVGAASPAAIDGEYLVVMEDGSAYREADEIAGDGGASVAEGFSEVDTVLVEATEAEALEIAAADGVAFF